MTDDAFVEEHIVNVAPEMVSGRIVRFLVEENDKVEQGQVLAEIEPIHFRDQVEQARGKLDLAKAELRLADARLAKAEADWQAQRRSPTVRVYFERVQRGDPQRKKIAVVATAHYLVRVMWALRKRGTTWEENPAQAK
jgi:membrane fusion protein (multidrug efflux system)